MVALTLASHPKTCHVRYRYLDLPAAGAERRRRPGKRTGAASPPHPAATAVAAVGQRWTDRPHSPPAAQRGQAAGAGGAGGPTTAAVSSTRCAGRRLIISRPLFPPRPGRSF